MDKLDISATQAFFSCYEGLHTWLKRPIYPLIIYVICSEVRPFPVQRRRSNEPLQHHFSECLMC